MLLNSYLLKRKKKKNFLLYFAIHRRNEGVVTYGIRAGSTRDLGFTTDVLNTVGVLGVFTFDLRFYLAGAMRVTFWHYL
jgi:hypothetical protein